MDVDEGRELLHILLEAFDKDAPVVPNGDGFCRLQDQFYHTMIDLLAAWLRREKCKLGHLFDLIPNEQYGAFIYVLDFIRTHHSDVI